MAGRSSSVPLPDSRSPQGCVGGLTGSVVAATVRESVSANVGIFDGDDGALSAGGSTGERSPYRDQAAVRASAGNEDDLVEWLRGKAQACKCVLAVSGGGYSGGGTSVDGCVMAGICVRQPWCRSAWLHVQGCPLWGGGGVERSDWPRLGGRRWVACRVWYLEVERSDGEVWLGAMCRRDLWSAPPCRRGCFPALGAGRRAQGGAGAISQEGRHDGWHGRGGGAASVR